MSMRTAREIRTDNENKIVSDLSKNFPNKKADGILPQSDNATNISGNSIKSGDEFDKIMQQIKEETELEEMKKFLDEKFNINTFITEYSCEKTDSKAESYDTSMLKQYDMTGGRNVIISKQTLLRMKKDSSFRQKVYQSIEDIPWSGKATGGCVKSNGVFIHEDGTGGYYLEFDWGDEEDGTKAKSNKIEYSGNPKENNINTLMSDEQSNMEFQTQVFSSLMGADLKDVRKNKLR